MESGKPEFDPLVYFEMSMLKDKLEWWEHFQTKCFNNVPVGRPLLGDRFKIVVENPFTGEWEDVWVPAAPSQNTLDISADATSA